MTKSKFNLSEYNKEYYRKNKARILIERQVYRMENKERLKEYDRIRYLKNREKIKEAVRKYYQENREAMNFQSNIRQKLARIKKSNEKWLLREKK